MMGWWCRGGLCVALVLCFAVQLLLLLLLQFFNLVVHPPSSAGGSRGAAWKTGSFGKAKPVCHRRACLRGCRARIRYKHLVVSGGGAAGSFDYDVVGWVVVVVVAGREQRRAGERWRH